MSATIVVVMGVSGAGKSTVGRLLAGELGWGFADADELHPPANIAKMAAGRALSDADREPWLRAVAARIADDRDAGQPLVLACSALKRRYRDRLRGDDVLFVHLTVAPALLHQRLEHRSHHFMPAGLLSSQRSDLEPPGPDENAITIDSALSPEQVVLAVRTRLG